MAGNCTSLRTKQSVSQEPLPCIAQIWTRNYHETEKLRNALKPLLQTIDADFSLLCIGNYSLYHDKKSNVKCYGNPCQSKLRTPSLAVVLMLQEDHPFRGLISSDTFKSLPWKFHHKIELSNTKGQKIKTIAKQEFYQPGPGLPLWAICPVHFGGQQLRFTIFTRNFSAMVDFYRILTGKEVDHVKSNFCLFELFSFGNTSVQVALKQSTQLYPVPSETAILRFRVRNTDSLQTLLPAEFKLISRSLYTIHDPDGNRVLVEQVEKTRSCNRKNTMGKTFCANVKPKVPISTGEWSETSSFDSGQHSSSFFSTLDSTVSDTETFISETSSSYFDSPLWPESLNLTTSDFIQNSYDGLESCENSSSGHAEKTCKPWEFLTGEQNHWFDSLTLDKSTAQHFRSPQHDITAGNTEKV